jgi:hypothetical protein
MTTAPRSLGRGHPVRPPPLREHLRDLRARPSAMLAVAHNLVPVVGVLALDWSIPLVVFTFWFDGFAAMVAIVTALMPRLMRETLTAADGAVKRVLIVPITWVVLVGILCVPYWAAFLPLGEYLTDGALWQTLRTDRVLWATFAGIAGIHVVTAARRGYGELPEKELKQKLRWDAYLLILRAIAMFVLVLPGIRFLLVPMLALAFSYIEIWPQHALGLVWGDPGRLHEDPET